MTTLHQPRSSFVIRIWWEQASDSQPIWRGWVQHVRSGEAIYVSDLPALLHFIEHHTGPLAQTQSAAPDRSKEEVMMNDR